MHAGDLLDARYELVRRLDVGGMGEVWEGIDRRIRRKVAVKLIREEADPALVPELVSRLGREATAAGRLAHPHIVAVYDYNSIEQDDVPLVYIVMELVRGRSLAEELTRALPSVPQALSWAEQIALALESAHGPEAGVVHRDLKPGNVMITYGGLVKLLDFGIARFLEDNDTHHTRLTGARMVGTPAYMAPEQCNAGPVDGRTDLYALGCLLYTMLTGRPPFTAERGLLQVMYQQVHETPPPPGELHPGVPPGLDRLVMELLAKDPADRPADAGAVVDRLRGLAAEFAAAAHRPAADPPPSPSRGSGSTNRRGPTRRPLPAGPGRRGRRGRRGRGRERGPGGRVRRPRPGRGVRGAHPGRAARAGCRGARRGRRGHRPAAAGRPDHGDHPAPRPGRPAHRRDRLRPSLRLRPRRARRRGGHPARRARPAHGRAVRPRRPAHPVRALPAALVPGRGRSGRRGRRAVRRHHRRPAPGARRDRQPDPAHPLPARRPAGRRRGVHPGGPAVAHPDPAARRRAAHGRRARRGRPPRAGPGHPPPVGGPGGGGPTAGPRTEPAEPARRPQRGRVRRPHRDRRLDRAGRHPGSRCPRGGC